MANEIIDSVEQINTDRGYWFIRTDAGQCFDEFYQEGYVGIGWNEITIADILNNTPIEVKKKISDVYNLDPKSKRGKITASGVYNKIKRFNDIKKGDVVVIPSFQSSRLAFGIVNDDKIYNNNEKSSDCPYIKRRHVKWQKVESVGKLDGIFYKIVHGRHAISSLVDYQPYIDKNTSALFQKAGFVHFIFEVKRDGNIDFRALTDLIDSIDTLAKELVVYFDLPKGENELSIKLNLQSPGQVEFSQKAGLLVIAMAFVISSCTHGGKLGDVHHNGKDLKSFTEINQTTLDTLKKSVDTLQIQVDMMNKY